MATPTPRRAVMATLWRSTKPLTAAQLADKIKGLDSRQVGSVLRPLVQQGFVFPVEGTKPTAYAVHGALTYRDAR